MDELLHTLARHRRRIRRARAADSALRWAFYASVAGCIGLAVSKFAGIALPLAVAAAVLGSVPVAMALREWIRAFSLRDCAIHLDRILGLEERLSTAIEGSGTMSAVVTADAAGALTRAPIPPRRVPREGGLLGGSLVILAALLALPSLERSGAKGDPAFEAVLAEEAAKLESLSNVDVQFKKAAEALKEGRPEAALAVLEELRSKLAAKMLEGAAGAGAETQKELDQAASSTAAISAELARLGRTIHAPAPAVAQAKLERQKIVEEGVAAAADASAAPAPARSSSSENEPWSPRYDPVIRKYFGRVP